MKRLTVLLLIVAILFGVAASVRAEISIDQLIQQAGIEEGDVAVRDMPRWDGARKIMLRNTGFDMTNLFMKYQEIDFITVNSLSDAMEHVHDVDAIIGFCDQKLVESANRLIWIQHFSAGVEHCLAVAKVGNGEVVLTNMQKMSSPVIAEHAIAMMMSLTRHLPQFVNRMAGSDWQRGPAATDGMMSIAGKRLLVVGLGGIGTEVARLGAALGMHVSATRNSSRDGPDFIEYVGLSHELPTLIAEADVIVNALPLTASTNGIFDSVLFDAVKPGAVFVNVGRGKTVVTEDLVVALESGLLSGAGLDVTDPEPLPKDSPLWQRDNVIITPHISSRGEEHERHAVLLQENLQRFIAGDPLLNVVDPKKGY